VASADSLADFLPVNRDRLVERDIKAACDKVVALPFVLLSEEAGRDTDGTLAVCKKLSH
jgi:hypothetical protein